MRQFQVQIKTVQDARDFMALATSRSFLVMVGDDAHQVNGKSFMELFCLNLKKNLTCSVDCCEEDFQQFFRDADRFLVK